MKSTVVLADIVSIDVSVAHPRAYPSITGHCLRNWALRDENLRERVDILTRAYGVKNVQASAVAADILAQDPLLVGFSCYVWSVSKIWEIAAALRRKRPDLRIAVGGPEVAPWSEQILRDHPEVDFASHAEEGEEVFRRLLRHLVLGEGSPADVPGISYWDGGEIRTTPAPAFIDLDSAPELYAGSGAALAGMDQPSASPIAVLEASRGCPFACKYCDWGDRKTRYVSLGKLEREFRALMRVRPGNGDELAIFLVDADILMNQRRGAEILRSFLEGTQGGRQVLGFNTNPIFVTPEITDIIARAPEKFYLGLGVQSIHAPVLDKVSRAFDRQRVERNLRYLNRKAPGTRVEIELIFGMPGDDLDGFRASVEWALRVRPQQEVWANQLLLLPGAAVYEEASSLGLRHSPRPPYQVTETDAMSPADIMRACEMAVYLFLFRSFPQFGRAAFAGLSWDTESSYVGRLEDWIDHLKSVGLSLCISGEYNRDIHAASDRLHGDPLFATAILAASQKFAQARSSPSPRRMVRAEFAL